MTSTTERAHRQFKRILLAGALLASAASTLAQAASPAGLWQTIDDATGQPKAVVQIVQESDGTLSGKILEGIGSNNDPTRRCTACTDSRKDQLVKGMTIINGMKPDGDAWDGGQILDPENGKSYKCKMHLDDDGQKLVVRGYIGVSLLGRSQTWIRQQ
ncbi:MULTISPECIES: DUF2147 domain-containing protein [Burkholderiaceae]|jgi:uncharacterized protein (DUF2147 family)|uniref:DUF2147 domain-containing protein n=1 Tax=Caballeronia sordidicola TaxID=196367 RepID=A0A242MDG9_CABSO|nr:MULTISPECIES: DUF2147 domain-containing protein [Burkholderiaceae]MDP9155424.1 DUF2147 domain-containing protein [Pseudomonadota bacterium]AME24931.1 hypothetical protein AXG89_14815 [Burkholderia sp. PAMC 26561]AMM14173.1 hypothetical protein AX768_08755 [Burkholderia sp. PAMC 28687]OTP69346.1 hypothetical protein PAMC26577_30375 [Caballeronia sordidicola]OTP72498.1 hypothetical protein PAMC26510_21965 [Caballeronia sordidicola]